MRLLLFLSLALAISGCASVGGGSSGPEKVAIGDISQLPQVQLPGASMEEARSVAMAAARTRGWDITAADANRLLLERPLSPDLPQARALSSPLAPPRMQVKTAIVDRRDGAIVALQAFVLTNPATQDEKRIDYTSEYENQLLISLSSLSSAWIAARDKVRSDVPTLAQFEASQGAEADAGGDLGNVAETVGTGGAAMAAVPSPEPAPRPEATRHASAPGRAPTPAPAPRAVQRSAPAAALAEPAASGTSSVPAASSSVIGPSVAAPTPSQLRPGPSLDGGVPAPAPIAPTAPLPTAASNDMLVLNQGARKGLWAYYAEDYARLRGCAIGNRGAMLLQQADGTEVHEVECVGKANILVKCRGGVCESMR